MKKKFSFAVIVIVALMVVSIGTNKTYSDKKDFILSHKDLTFLKYML